MKTIHYLGPEGSYSHTLTLKSFGKNAKLVGEKDFDSIIERVLKNDNAIGVLPIETSITSNVHENIDFVFNHMLRVAGEGYLLIALHLIGHKAARQKDVTQVHSHPKALAQCSRFITEHRLKTHPVSSTAEATQIIINDNQLSHAAIGGRPLAKNPKLKILVENIGNVKSNHTRFIFVTKKLVIATKGTKATFVFTVKHQPGALAILLTALSGVGVNLTKLESRPIPDTDWEYQFWADLEFPNTPLRKVKQIFDENTLEYTNLGVYERGKIYTD